MSNKKLIIVNGPSCSGKSTVIKGVLKQRENWFYLSYDSLKWQFSNYTSGKYKEDILALLLVMADKAFVMGYNIMSDAGLTQVWREDLKTIAEKYGYAVVEVNLEASSEVLEKRFDQRIAEAAKNPRARIANTSKERFKELHNLYQNNKNPNAIVFRTDIGTAETAVNEMLELM